MCGTLAHFLYGPCWVCLSQNCSVTRTSTNFEKNTRANILLIKNEKEHMTKKPEVNVRWSHRFAFAGHSNMPNPPAHTGEPTDALMETLVSTLVLFDFPWNQLIRTEQKAMPQSHRWLNIVTILNSNGAIFSVLFLILSHYMEKV